MIDIDYNLTPTDLTDAIERMWQLSAVKIRSIEADRQDGDGTPVITVDGRYKSQGWTEWTQGFQFGSAILQFDATDDEEFLSIGRDNTIARMAAHVTHIGVHDHGFNNVSTYGNLRRLILEGRIEHNQRELDLYELALKASGAVQAARWSNTSDGGGYIYSFNGPHSLFSDTIRSLRALALAHSLGHRLMSENDKQVSLLDRLVTHAQTTAKYNVYYGKNRDRFDIRGRVVHESIFNTNDGKYRCPSTQQGYSPFSTWTRGLAWIVLGYAELLKFLPTVSDEERLEFGGRETIESFMFEAARAASDFYIDETPTDGVPYWDTGAPHLTELDDYLNRPSDPFNQHEPVDSSAAVIAAQGLLRLAESLRQRGISDGQQRYRQAGLTVLRTLLDEPYLATDEEHQGLLLHSVYHHPNGWDHVPAGSTIPHGESCQWGDYHMREAALHVDRIIRDAPYYSFFGPAQQS